jgi:hypothetical protein
MAGHGDRVRRLGGGVGRATLLFAFATALALVMCGRAYGDFYTQPTRLYMANDMRSPATAFPIDGPAIATARRIADATWGYDPCGGDVTLSWSGLGPTANAAATWWNPTAAYANPTQNSSCSVTFNELQAFDWPMLCTILMHEFGHLTGHMHRTDPNGVMFPTYTRPIGDCATTPNPQPGVTTTSPSRRRKRAPPSSRTQRRVRPRRAPDQASAATSRTALAVPFSLWSVATLP